jgi:hypothetical protein
VNPIFQLAGGTTIGRDHRLVPKNNQDSFAIWKFDDITIGVVADRCGSGAHCEIGAAIGVQILGSCLKAEYAAYRKINWGRTQQHMLSQLDILAQAMGSDYRNTVENYFLFTLVGIVLDDQMATFFALGDGTVIVNDQKITLGPFPGNMPPYLGYGLLPGELAIDPATVKLEPMLELPLGQLESFLIATDGINDLIANSHATMPGLDRVVGEIDQFWLNDRYFRGNPELVSRQLKLIGRDWPLNNPQPGHLGDDTTLIVGRRKEEE